VIQAMASMTRATTSERRIARNARFTDKASVVLPADAMAALFLIPAVSISWNFYRKENKKIIIVLAQNNKRLPNHYDNLVSLQLKQSCGWESFITNYAFKIFIFLRNNKF